MLSNFGVVMELMVLKTEVGVYKSANMLVVIFFSENVSFRVGGWIKLVADSDRSNVHSDIR